MASDKSFSRREVVTYLGVGVAGVALGAAVPQSEAETPTRSMPAPFADPTVQNIRNHHMVDGVVQLRYCEHLHEFHPASPSGYKPMPPMHSWFWRPGFQMQDPQVIADAYRACRQRNSNLLLNLSPETSGRLPDEVVKSLQQVRKLINK